jgi:hypothetical protein
MSSSNKKKTKQTSSNSPTTVLVSPVANHDITPAGVVAPVPLAIPKNKVADAKKTFDIIGSKISVIIDLLESDTNEQISQKNIATALKHLKLISEMVGKY